MPENDLGTAHGRIRITYEGKGAEKAEASIHKMAAQLEAANKRLEKLEKELQKSNKALEQTSTEMRKASRTARILDRDVLKTARRFRAFRGDVRMLKDELDGLHRGVNRARNGFAALSIAARIFNRTGQIDAGRQRLIFRSLAISMAELAARTEGTAKTINNAQEGIFKFLRAADRLKGTRATVTLMGAGWVSLRNKILGVGKEIDRAPNWVKKLNLVVKSVSILGSSLGLLSAVMGPLKLMEMFAKSGVLGAIAKGMNLNAIAFKRFGNISQRVFGKDIFSGFVRRLVRGQNEINRTLGQGTIGFQRWADSLRNNSGRMIRWAADSKYLLTGVAAFINGIGNMWSRLQWFFKLPKTLMAGLALFFARVLPSALSGTGKALSALSNLFLGLIDGVMQLGAGLTVIPGIIATIGASVMGLFPIFKGLADQFKDLFDEDPTKRWEALGKLPDHLKPIGFAINDILPRWKELQKELQTFALAGVDKQMRELADTIFPLLREGSMRVGGAFRTAKDRLVEFVQEAKTGADVKNIYGSTAQMINTMADAIKPALRGFMDMAAVGAEFLQVTATWVPILTQRFQQWAQVNRQNGNMMNWMVRARQGVFDLADGIVSAAKAARTLLSVFSTNTGEDFLQRFADSMERMNTVIERSRATGFLARLRNAAANMGQEKMGDVIRLWKIFTNLVESLIPFISELSNAFSTIFLRALEGNMRLIGAFLDLLNAIGATPFIGWILGVIAAAKILPKVFATALTALKTFWGFFMILRNREKVVNGLTTAFDALGAKMSYMRGPFRTVGNGMVNTSAAFGRMAGMIGTLVSGFAVAGVAVLAFWSVWSQAGDNSRNALKALEDSKNGVIEFGDALRKSFLADRTLVGRNVMNTVSDGLNTMMSDLQNVESNMPGATNHIKDFFKLMFTHGNTGSTEEFNRDYIFATDTKETNRLQEAAAAAGRAREQFTALKDEGVDLNQVITSSDESYKSFTDGLRANGKGDAANALDVYRQKFEQIEESMRALGPAGADVANGIKAIGEAGSDAAEKLDGLRLVLQGLGYLKTDTLQATAEYTEAIQTMADKVTEALTGIGDSGDAWNANGINLATDAGRALLDVLVPVSQKFQAMAANGGDANQMWTDMQGEIDATVTALNNAGVKIDKNTFVQFLQQQLGVSPVPIALALQIDNTKDPIAKQFGQAMLSLQGLADNGVFAPIFFDTEQAAKDLDQALEKVLGHDVTDVNGNNLVLKPGIQLQPDDLAQLQAKLQEYGFKFGPQGPVLTPNVTPPAPGAPVQAPPLVPGQPAPAPPPPPPAIGTPAIAPPALPGQIPPTPTPQIIVGAPEVVHAALDNIKKKMDEIDQFNPTIDFNLDLTQTAIDRLNEVKTKIDEIKSNISDDKIIIDIQVLHVTESVYDLGRLQDKLNEVRGVVEGIAAAFLAAFTNAQGSVAGFIAGVQQKLDELVVAGKNAGSKFVDAMADGLSTNPAAIQAAERMADEIKKRFHQSPPKKGPLAAHGDAAKYAGGQFVQSYAAGVNANGAAVSAAEKMGLGATRGAMAGDKNYEAGQYLGQLSQLSNFAALAVDAFSKLANTVMSAVSFASDPLGKGTFFGKRQGYVRDPSMSDQERQQKKEDAAQQRALSFYGSGQRPDLYDPATGRLKGQNVGTLSPGASQQDKANFIIDKAMSLGYSRDQANQFLVQAVGESGLAPDATSANGLWKGIFQFDTATWEGAGGGDINDAQKNIENYFALAAQRGLTPENFKDPHQLGTQVSIGGPLNPKNVGHEATARAAAEQYITGYQQGMGQVVDGIAAGVPAAIGNLPPSTKLNTEPGLEPNAVTLAALLEAQFPGITSIGGKEARSGPQMHPNGRALDVGVGSGPSAATLGDQINAFVQANAAQFGVQSTIWRDKGLNLVANEGGGPGSTYTAGGHGGPSGTDSSAHVHIQFADGGKLDVAPDGTMTMNVPAGSPGANMDFGLPRTPEQIEADAKKAPTRLVTRNPDGSFSEVHTGDGAAPGDDKINPATGRPWTPEEATEFWNRPENALQYDESQLREGDLSTPGVFQGTEDQMLDALKGNNPELAKAIATAQDYNSSDEETIAALNLLNDESQRQKDLDTPESRARSSQLDSVISGAASDRGLVEEQTPVQKAQEVVGAATSIAGDVFAVLNSAIEAVGAAKNIGDTLVRGVENTEDIYAMIDDIQKFIQLGADVAGAVSSIASTAGSFTGGMDMGITSAVGSVAGLIQGALETVNAMIDLGQEAYRIIGSYVGDFLGILAGGAGGALQGNVKFLLDEANNQLLTYSQDNPLDKRNFDGAGTDPNMRNQMIGNINVYGGPGQDPRDNTRQMMFQVKASTMGQATGQ